MEQIVRKDGLPRKLTVLTEDAIHYPSTSQYSVKNMYYDLLNYSVKNLKLGGRLVCWFPIMREEFTDKMLPRHSALDLISCSEQVLSSETSRLLLTYEKINQTGEFIESSDLSEFDFRTKYFMQGGEGTRDERRLLHYETNLREAAKRGKTILNRVEHKKLKNKMKQESKEKLLMTKKQCE
jgi:tRNA (guanine10-N2)-methyltransferase